MNQEYRIGNGYDIHRLVPDRNLIIGGINIPHELGLLGHSDADVLVHSIIDSLLGALALGDIGKHFPPSDPRYKDIDSLKLLKLVKKLVDDKRYIINNIDAVIQAEKPKLLNHIPLMRETLAEVLDIDLSQISIKATTMEGIGAIGECKAIAAQSIALLTLSKNPSR